MCRNYHTLASVMLLLTVAANILAEDVPTPPPPQAMAEHKWLEQFVGEWESNSEAKFAPGADPMTCKGQSKIRMIGEFWMVSEATGEAAGQPMHAIQTVGYDPNKKTYVGTWVDSMFNHLWHYEGFVAEDGKTLVLEAEGPNFMTPGKTAMFRDSYKFESPDHIIATSAMQGEDGKWITFMTGHMRRRQSN